MMQMNNDDVLYSCIDVRLTRLINITYLFTNLKSQSRLPRCMPRSNNYICPENFIRIPCIESTVFDTSSRSKNKHGLVPAFCIKYSHSSRPTATRYLMVWYGRVQRPTRQSVGHFGDGEGAEQ